MSVLDSVNSENFEDNDELDRIVGAFDTREAEEVSGAAEHLETPEADPSETNETTAEQDTGKSDSLLPEQTNSETAVKTQAATQGEGEPRQNGDSDLAGTGNTDDAASPRNTSDGATQTQAHTHHDSEQGTGLPSEGFHFPRPQEHAAEAGQAGDYLLIPTANYQGPPPPHEYEMDSCGCAMCMNGASEGPILDGAVDGDSAPGAATTIATLADYLVNGYWNDTGRTAHWFNMTNSGTGANNGTIYYNVDGWSEDANGLVAGRQEMVRNAFDVYEDILGINFVETTSTAGHVDIFFKDNASGANANYVYHSGSGGAVDWARINITSGWDSGNTNIGSWAFTTALHEIGHVLGLGHQGDYNAGAGSPSYNNSAHWANDTLQQTIMSYWAQSNYTPPGHSTPSNLNPIGLMAVDWRALEILYGSQGYGVGNGETTGNTTWGFNDSWSSSSAPPVGNLLNNAFNSMSTMLDTNSIAIVDGGGIDTLDLSGFSNNTRIDVSEAYTSSSIGSLSNVAGRVGNLSIAPGTIIENVVGGSGSELIYGNDANNHLDGNGGNDTIHGYGGQDTLLGAGGNDTLYGGSGNDSLEGGTGNDYLHSGLDNDTLRGDSGDDSLYGSSGNDFLHGGSGKDTLRGGSDNDILQPGSGLVTGEIYDGDSGTDTLNFSNFFSSYLVNLQSGDFDIGATQTTLISIENVDAGNGNDTITGSTGANVLDGNAGNDLILGGDESDSLIGGSGNDTLDGSDGTGSYLGDVDTLRGGSGDDTLRYSQSTTGTVSIYDGGADTDTFEVTSSLSSSWHVNLAVGQFQLTGGNRGTLISIENATVHNSMGVTGSSGANVITGIGNFSNTFDGGGGNDTINGGGGNDSLIGGLGIDTILGGDGNDTLLGGLSTDSLSGGDGDDLFRVLNGEYFDNVDGGSGNDTLDHSAVTRSGDTFDFLTGQIISTYDTGTPTLSGLEHFIDGSGSNTIIWYAVNGGTVDAGAGNDTVHSGNNANETLDGGAGIDTLNTTSFNGNYEVNLATGLTNYTGESFINFENLISGGGNDLLTGNSSNNDIDGGAGNDTLSGGGGIDTLRGGDGDDRLNRGGGGSLQDEYYGGAGIDTIGADGIGFSSTVVFNLASGYMLLSGLNYEIWNGFENYDGSTGTGGEGVVGTSGANLIETGSGANDLDGGSGNDTLLGGGGNDTLEGGSGIDSIDGGDGDDTIVQVNGWTGGDTYNGGAGVDTLDYSGTAGYNSNADLAGGTLTGLGAAITLSGIENVLAGNGSDTLTGSAEANLLDGGDGNDILLGGDGADSLVGGAGNDTLDGSDGTNTYLADNDTLRGGDGDDLLLYTQGGTGVTGNIFDGGADTDTLRIDPAVGPQTNNQQWEVNLTTNLFTLNTGIRGTLISIENVEVAGGHRVIGGAGANVISGLGIGNNTFDGAGGSDTIDGAGGDDSILGGDGDDSVIGGDGNDTLDGSDGTGTYQSSNDTLEGGAGDDVLLYTQDGTGVSGNIFDGGADTDLLWFTSTNLNSTWSVNLETGDFLFGSGSRGSILGIENVRVDNAMGVIGDDTDNVITGTGAFHNTFSGGKGNDTINGGGGNDTLNGNGGDDVINGANNNDLILGGWGNDSLLGGGHNDHLEGGNGNDTLEGGWGNDVLLGGIGADSMDGGTGFDTLSYKGSTIAVDVNLDTGIATGGDATGDAFANIENLLGSGHADTLTGDTNANALTGAGGNDTLNGDGGADTLKGGGADDLLYGKIGNDRLQGGDGNDDLRGGADDDRLIGGNGIDTLNGGSGNDTLSGGSKKDVFVFGNNFGNDIITDFAASDAEDINLSAVTAINNFTDLITNHLSDNGGFAQIDVGVNSILLEGVAFANVGVGLAYSADDFIF